ncbi:unnamed protein product [Sphacelaria rigidula]
MASIKLVMAVTVQEEWPLYNFDVTQAFVQAKMDTDVNMRLPEGCYVLIDMTVKLETSIYGIKQVVTSSVSNFTRGCRVVLCEAGPCVFKMEDAGEVRVISKILNDKFPTNDLGEVTWYMGCAVNRDWNRAVTQTTFTDTLLKRFEVRGYSETPASVFVRLGPTRSRDTVVNRPYRNAVGDGDVADNSH